MEQLASTYFEMTCMGNAEKLNELSDSLTYRATECFVFYCRYLSLLITKQSLTGRKRKRELQPGIWFGDDFIGGLIFVLIAIILDLAWASHYIL